MMGQSTVTEAYNADWQKKALEDGRLKSQERVYCALSMLFNEVLRVPLKGKVLDLGCGDGSLVKILNRKDGIIAAGIDIKDGVNFETDVLPYGENEFDIAIMYAVIEHLNNPSNILAELRRVTKKNGKIIVITSNFDLSHPMVCDKAFFDDPTHVHSYNPMSIQHLMRLYNFKKKFIGLWTVPKSSFIWKLPMQWQFYIGALLPFRGSAKYAPSFLKGKSKIMLCVFGNDK